MEGMPFEGPTGEKLRKALLIMVCVLAVFLLVEAVGSIMSWRYVGSGIAPTNTISVSGHGEVLSVPDVATFTFSVVSDKATVADAQKDATTKANAITAYVKSQNIDAKDIQTTDYSVYPQYEYQNAVCPAMAPVPGNVPQNTVYCPPGKQVLKGYEVRQTTTVKVHDTAKAGDLLTGVGQKGATEVSGLNFTFDDPKGIANQARDKAISDAKQKADSLAKSLGVSLVRVTSFNENGSGFEPRAMMAYGTAGNQAMDSKAVAPEVSVGQNKVTDDVSITYEIR
jgi:hypothetical protein